MVRIRILLLSITLVSTGCSAHYPLNKPISKARAYVGARDKPRQAGNSSDKLLVVVTFSGGGTRAAAFAYGVLEELAATHIQFDGRDRSLIDEVDVVSGVSGGSFTAAYFGLHGRDTLGSFDKRFLYRNVESSLKRTIFSPRNWARLYSPNYGRSDLVADWFDRHLFDHATFHDLTAVRGVGVIINATDITRGSTFSFVPDQFSLICSDLGSVPLARAVVASAAVPVLFSPISLRNYAGSCGYQIPDWMRRTTSDGDENIRRLQRARIMESYEDSSARPYIHLVDGGIADNLGLRAVLDDVLAAGGIRQTFARQRLEATTQVLFIVVNAQAGLNADWDKEESGPSTTAIIDSATTVQINRYNFETVELLRSTFAQWARDLHDLRCAARNAGMSAPGSPPQDGSACDEVKLHMVEVTFDRVSDEKQRQYLKSLPTSFALPDKAVDSLRGTARSLLRSAPEFQQFLHQVDPAAHAQPQ